MAMPTMGGYSASKFALEGWMEVLADEWAGRVYSVNPGGTATPMRAAAIAPAETKRPFRASSDASSNSVTKGKSAARKRSRWRS